jgi:hypothetical protein
VALFRIAAEIDLRPDAVHVAELLYHPGYRLTFMTDGE